MENYGGGKPCEIENTVLEKIETGLTLEDLKISDKEKDVLKHLSERVAQLAARPEMKEKRDLWTKHNMLEKTRPVVFCDPENGWNEIITEKQMKSTSKLARRWEMDLRKEIFWGEEMGDDRPVEPYFDVPYTAGPDDWGVHAVYHKTERLGSYIWDNPVKDYEEDLKKLRYPEINIDWETTKGCLALAEELFGGSLKVRLKGTWWWSLGMTLPGAALRGLSNILYDFFDHPEGLKGLFSFISRGYMKKLDFLEENDLLSLNNDGTYVGSGGYGFTKELPHENYRQGHVRCIDMWGFAESQETVNVSPDMYEEFIFPYEKPILSRFGLTCYGCCEPIHSRWQVVKRHKNLRRVSCSAWVDKKKMAEYLENKYIFSMKPNPALLAEKTVSEELLREDVTNTFETAKGCVVEIIMKDNHTIGSNPQNVVDWSRIAKEEAEKYE
jgi:hypothetical protein